MLEGLITISVVGLLAGFVFSMPIAGPISILITSNALKGRLRYCILTGIGASIADFIYVFAAVYGLTKFYTSVKSYIPYMFLAGAFFLVYLGYKIAKTKIDLEHMEDKSHLSERIRKQQRGGFLTGFLLNLLNPTLFLTWLTSSFILISFVTSLGFDTGGLEQTISNSYNTFQKGNKDADSGKSLSFLKPDSVKVAKHEPSAEQIAHYPKYYSEMLSAAYAFFIGAGSIAWFFLLSYMLVKHRRKVSLKAINRTINVLGIGLCIFGVLLGYKGIHILIQH